MKHTLAAIIVILGITAAAGAAAAQTKAARSASYEALSDANRRIVSAIYESQLGSRRDLAGHPLLSKDKITAMRRGGSWEQVFERLVTRGYVANRTLQDAMASYNRDLVPLSRPLIISTATGEQIVVPRRVAPRRDSPPPNPALANIIPTPPVRRAHIQTVELPALETSAGEIRSGATVESASSGLIAPSMAQSR